MGDLENICAAISIGIKDPTLERVVSISLGRNGLTFAIAVGFFKVGSFMPEWTGEKVDFTIAIDVTKGSPLGVDALAENHLAVGAGIGSVTGGDEEGNGSQWEEEDGKFHE